ncbi:glycosyltransferase family 4 protein [Arundinibacter roseus]|uniref:Glycosyltransferase n=1 Tax=Arundinibacter roseus TaxID=2070510 RepID=A0A4R4K9J7_9BACT|nr:glycosyltransferase family 4 protein [Arundinibacter roseus]TDB64487.1 glycosyltransferase [Arundinibacter roseus]
MNSQKVLFISHDANRAGSQLLLLQLISLLKQKGLSTHLLLGYGGDLESEFRQVTDVTVLEKSYQPVSRFSRGLSRLSIFSRQTRKSTQKDYLQVKKELIQANIGLVFVNSVANAEFYEKHLTYLHELPVVLFAHELEMSVGMYTNEISLNFLLQKCCHLITVSKAVSSYYIGKHNFPEQQISTFTLINTQEISEKLAVVDPDYLKKELGIPQHALVVGGCGNAEWRKGNDIFNLVAHEVIFRKPELPVYFVWIGAGPSQPFFEQIKFDIERFELQNRILLIPPTPKALDCMTRFDVFLLSSREDPYPLVVLEAALLQKPIVCFDKAGGAPELVEQDAGMVVDYLDIQATADAVLSLLEQPEIRRSKGQRAYQKVLQRHNTEQSIQNVLNIIRANLPQVASITTSTE